MATFDDIVRQSGLYTPEEYETKAGAIEKARQEAVAPYTSRIKSRAADAGKAAARMQAIRAPDAPKLDELPEAPKSEYKDPVQAIGSLSTLLAVIGSLKTRAPLTSSLNAMAGAVKGFHEGDEQRITLEKKNFKEAFDRAIRQNDTELREYQAALEKAGFDMTKAQADLSVIASQNKDDAMMAALESGNFEKQQHILDQRQNIGKKLANLGEQDALRRLQVQSMADYRRALLNRDKTPSSDAMPTPQAEAMAWDYLIKGHNPPARGGAYGQAMNAVAYIARQNNMSVRDLLSASADVKTRLAAKSGFERRVQNLQRAENQLELEIPVMESAMKKLDNPEIPIAARGNIIALREMGNADVTTLDQAAEAVLDEWQGIITGNPGTLNVQDVLKAAETYKKIQTPQGMRAWIDGAHRIISNAKKANDKTRSEIMGGINRDLTGGGGGGAAPKQVMRFDAQGNPVQ